MCCIRAHQFTTMVVIIVYCAYYESLYFSLSDDICVILIVGNYRNYELIIDFFTFIFGTSISQLLFKVMNLRFAMCVLKYIFEGRVSPIFHLGPSFNFM